MRVPREAQAQRYLKAIRQNMEKLEALLNEPQAVGQEPRPQDRRTELLEHIHVMGVVDQHRLFRMLNQRRIPHTWIGAQSRASYLEMWTAAGGNVFYRATEKAVEELNLLDTFPSLTLSLVGGGRLTLPDEIETPYAILLFYRGNW